MATGQIIIPATMIKVTSFLHNDAGETMLVCGINLNSGVATAECYKVPQSLTGIVRVGIANVGGKDDSVSGVVYKNGMVRMTVSEADPPAGSGSTSAVRVYDYPEAFPDGVVGSGSVDTFIRTTFKNFLIDLRNVANKFIALIP